MDSTPTPGSGWSSWRGRSTGSRILLTDWGVPSDAIGTADEVVDLRVLLSEVVVLRDAASPGSVVLRPGPAPLVRLDRRALCRLVTNLVDNAVRAAGPGGVVELDLEDSADPVVRIADDGPGPGAGPRGEQGMGLVVVRTLARRLGAEVTLRPRRGGGTVAEVVLRESRDVRVPTPRRPGSTRPDDASAPPSSGQVARGPGAPG